MLGGSENLAAGIGGQKALYRLDTGRDERFLLTPPLAGAGLLRDGFRKTKGGGNVSRNKLLPPIANESDASSYVTVITEKYGNFSHRFSE